MADAQPSIVQPHRSPPLPPPLLTTAKRGCDTTHPVHKTLAAAANIANLLPTGTVLAFQTLAPPFSNKGVCEPANVFLTACLIAICAILCFLSSFTDSFIDKDGKLYYGIATFRGLYIFNCESYNKIQRELPEDMNEFSKFKISPVDFLHAFVSILVFLIFALGDSDVHNCFFPKAGENLKVLMMNLPVGAGVFASFLFVLFPTTRRGIGYADMPH